MGLESCSLVIRPCEGVSARSSVVSSYKESYPLSKAVNSCVLSCLGGAVSGICDWRTS